MSWPILRHKMPLNGHAARATSGERANAKSRVRARASDWRRVLALRSQRCFLFDKFENQLKMPERPTHLGGRQTDTHTSRERFAEKQLEAVPTRIGDAAPWELEVNCLCRTGINSAESF